MSQSDDSQERRVRHLLPELAKVIDNALECATGERRGFLLLTFPFDRPGTAQYVSNAERESATKAMKRHVEIWEGGMPDVSYRRPH